MLSNKGVSPILATVLVILIVIAVAGGFLVYVQQQQSVLEETGAEQINEITERTAQNFQIVSISCSGPDVVVLRNLGSQAFSNADVTFLVDGTIVTTAPTWSASPSGCTTTNVAEECLLQASWSSNQIDESESVSVQIGEASANAICQ